MFCFCFLFIFNDSGQTNYAYLRIYRTDLRRVFRVGGTVPVDDESQVGFSIPQRKLPWQPNFVGFSACRWMRAASGEGGRVNWPLNPYSP